MPAEAANDPKFSLKIGNRQIKILIVEISNVELDDCGLMGKLVHKKFCDQREPHLGVGRFRVRPVRVVVVQAELGGFKSKIK